MYQFLIPYTATVDKDIVFLNAYVTSETEVLSHDGIKQFEDAIKDELSKETGISREDIVISVLNIIKIADDGEGKAEVDEQNE